MNTTTLVISALAGYLIGAISSARLVTRLIAPGAGVDVETVLSLEGSDKTLTLRTVSASSVSVRYGSRAGFLTYVLDLVKVAVPVAVFRYWHPEWPYHLVVSTTAFIGHVWPVYYRFKGGRGLSALYGSMLVIDWIGMLVTAIGGMLFGLGVARSIIVCYFAGVWFIVPWLWFRTHEPSYLIYSFALNLLFTIAMMPEIRAWRKIARDGTWSDPTVVIELSAMGRGIVKLGRKLGLIKPRAGRPGTGASAPPGRSS
jgi:glycerol-3-phosphate acyltransferase PlsY